MNARMATSRISWLCAALLVVGCGTTTSGGGGAFVADATSDLSISFGGKDATAGKDTGAAKDAAKTDTLVDAGADDTALDDAAVLDDATDFFDPDIAGTDVTAPTDTGVKDVGGKDTTVKDTATDTGVKDTGGVDGNGTCGNGTCDSGETCQTCAVDCACTPCNPLTSVGCAKSQQCYVTNTGLTCGGFGTVADGGLCTNLNDCAVGSMCIGGLCRKICATAGSKGPSCSGAATCEELVTSSGSVGYNLGACFAPDNCNLTTSVGCATGFACMPGTTAKQCVKAGKVGLDGACTSIADCDVGFLCLNNGATSGTCKKRCLTTDASTCPSGLSCGGITIGDPPVLVGENFGVCDKP